MSAHVRERALVVAALAGALEGAWAAEGDLSGVEWSWVLRQLRAHRLGARFWSEAQRAGLMPSLPLAVREELEAEVQETAAHTARLLHLALEAGAALDRAGIPWLPMKGAALCVAAPAYGAARPMSDVDLLVHPRELSRAVEALRPRYPDVSLLRDYDGTDRSADEATRAAIQSAYTFHAEDGAVLELHHAFPGVPSRLGTEGAFERARAVVHRGRRVLVPSPEDLLGSACVHVLVHHGLRDPSMLLRHVADVCVLLAAGAPARRAQELYDVEGRDAVVRSLRLLAEAQGEARLRGGARSTVGVLLAPGLEGRLRQWAANSGWRLGEVLAGFRAHGVRAAFPPREFMVGLYGPAAAGARLPLLHLHRWGAILLRTFRGRP